MITFICWLWSSGNTWKREYDYTHVNTLQLMLRENVKIPHQLICITDNPVGIKCKTFPIWNEPYVGNIEGANCFRRLKLCDIKTQQELGLTDIIVSIDLDCAFLKDCTDIFTNIDKFHILQGYHNKYNGSLWGFKAGTYNHLWKKFNIFYFQQIVEDLKLSTGKKKIIGSDQVWFSFMVDDAVLWNRNNGIYFHQVELVKELRCVVPEDCRLVFFPGEENPWSKHTWRTTEGIYNKYMEYYERALYL